MHAEHRRLARFKRAQMSKAKSVSGVERGHAQDRPVREAPGVLSGSHFPPQVKIGVGGQAVRSQAEEQPLFGHDFRRGKAHADKLIAARAQANACPVSDKYGNIGWRTAHAVHSQGARSQQAERVGILHRPQAGMMPIRRQNSSAKHVMQVAFAVQKTIVFVRAFREVHAEGALMFPAPGKGGAQTLRAGAVQSVPGHGAPGMAIRRQISGGLRAIAFGGQFIGNSPGWRWLVEAKNFEKMRDAANVLGGLRHRGRVAAAHVAHVGSAACRDLFQSDAYAFQQNFRRNRSGGLGNKIPHPGGKTVAAWHGPGQVRKLQVTMGVDKGRDKADFA